MSSNDKLLDHYGHDGDSYEDTLARFLCDNAPAPLTITWEHPGWCQGTHPDAPDVFVAASPGWEGVPLYIEMHDEASGTMLGDCVNDEEPWSGDLRADAARYYQRVHLALRWAQYAHDRQARCQARADFVKAVYALAEAAHEVAKAWDHPAVPGHLGNATWQERHGDEPLPFNKSFDEWAPELGTWADCVAKECS